MTYKTDINGFIITRFKGRIHILHVASLYESVGKDFHAYKMHLLFLFLFSQEFF